MKRNNIVMYFSAYARKKNRKQSTKKDEKKIFMTQIIFC